SSLSFHRPRAHRHLHSFPTRRSSDLSPLLYIFLALPPLFTLITLFVGIGEMTFWFNSRFLILLAPLLILLSSTFIDRIWRKYGRDRKSTRLNSSHVKISYAVFCLKKK